MKDPDRESDRWLRQAENDLEFAESGLQKGFYSQVCFLSQQVGEKAVKAIHYGRGERFVLGHSIYDLLRRLKMEIPDEERIFEIAGVLDQFYIPTRYPNSLPEGAPYEIYTKKQAEEAVRGAERLVLLARDLLKK